MSCSPDAREVNQQVETHAANAGYLEKTYASATSAVR